MQATFKNRIAKYLIILVGIGIAILAIYNVSQVIISKTTKAEVLKVLDTKQVKRGRHKPGYKYYTDYLVQFETADGTLVETNVTEMRLSEGQYQEGDTMTVDVFSDNTAVAHVNITQKIPMILLGLFGLFLTYCGIIGKVVE